MKSAFTFAVIASVCVAQAQQSPSQARIEAGLEKLRGESQLYLYVEGSETIGSVTNRYKTHLYWQVAELPSQRATTKFQLLQVHENAPGGPLLLQRIVGNGDTVWNYDHQAKEYSALQYGGYGSARPAKYTQNLLQFITSTSTGQAAWATKLLREIHTMGDTTQRSWMPGVQPYELPDGSTPDPLWSDRVYSGTPTVDHVMYNGSPRRSIVFELEEDSDTSAYRLSNLFFTERGRVGNKDRMVEWKLTPFKGIAFDEKNFAPYTYAETRGWRPRAASARVGS